MLDTPEQRLRKALQPEEKRLQEQKEKEVLENIRFLWEGNSVLFWAPSGKNKLF